MQMPSVPMGGGAGLFAGGFPKLRPTGKTTTHPEAATAAPALPSRPRPQTTNSAQPATNNPRPTVAPASPRKGPPPVPPRMAASSPKKTNPPTPINSMNQKPADSNGQNFLSQVKLRPTGNLNSSSSTKEQPDTIKPSRLSNAAKPIEETKPAAVKTNGFVPATVKPEYSKPEEPKAAAKVSMKPLNDLKLPPVPEGFSGTPKEYPSGAKKGLQLCRNNNNLQLEQLEKELKEAAIREDFEQCVELKKKISQLKV